MDSPTAEADSQGNEEWHDPGRPDKRRDGLPTNGLAHWGRARAGESIVAAPMPGHVRAVVASQADAVVKEQTLFLLEAMKMEMRIQAARSGKLARATVRVGESVKRQQMLAEIV